VLPEPDAQFSPAETTRGQVEHEPLLLIDGGMDLRAVEQKKGAHRPVSHALVPVDEGMPLPSANPKAPAFSIRLPWRSLPPNEVLG
jgi:hypothetical protein